MTDHFRKGGCKNVPYTVQTLEKLYGNGRTARVALDASITSKRKQKQEEWILKLQTVFSCGLIDCPGGNFIKEDPRFLLGAKLPAVPRKSTRISRGHVHKLNTPDRYSEFSRCIFK